ncbi:hypothetical protein [Spirosoma sordidisoli]|uniref:Uncharacterized protein n=1 Tax=Spirosoma sordidisoli TaxID=2502893 RepID=A0A4V1RVC1_9BACT|nr:hypothetical protein [Spirosoma sordidisoli]RYC66248.1 hypothetical protein EQG79_30560 [Spirosoma sordidisoli]
MTDKIVEFPISKIGNYDHLTEREIVYQLRLEAIELINRLNTRKTYLPLGTDMEGLHTINQLCIEHGFGTLDFTDIKPVNVAQMGYLSED